MADGGQTFHRIVVDMLDDEWRDAFIAELGDKRGPAAIVFAAHRASERLSRG